MTCPCILTSISLVPDNQSVASNNKNGLAFPFAMSGDKQGDDVTIPSLLISHDDGQHLVTLLQSQTKVQVLLTWDKSIPDPIPEDREQDHDNGEQERDSVKSP